MKYLVAANAANLDAKVHKRFGYADDFLVVDPETLEYVAYPGVGHNEPLHGIGKLQKEGIERVIVGNIGPEAFQDVKGAGWEVYLCRGMTVREAVEKVHSGQFIPIEKPTMKQSVHKGRHLGGGDHQHGVGSGKK